LQGGDESTIGDTYFRVGIALDPEIVKTAEYQTPPVIPSNQANFWKMLQAFLLKAVAD
jgi:hypothetical protein